MHTDCTVPYGEVDGFSALLGYQTANAAGCKVQTALPYCPHVLHAVVSFDNVKRCSSDAFLT